MSDSSALPKSCPKCGVALPSEATEGLCPKCLMAEAMLPTGGSKPSAPWQPPTAAELHKLLPQYEIELLLGRGGMGAVYKGRQISLDRPVAIKILSNTLDEADASFAERFKNEARAMAKLTHPGIVAVYDFGQTVSGLLYIVMEFIEGTDVSRMIAKQKRLHTEHAMAITAHVCDALAYAHERGIIHRDIKPANIMVGYDGVVKVADFGLAKMNSKAGESVGLTQSGMAMGTLHYMAPEALMLGSAVDHRADIYAVGVMLYQMLTGKVPHGMFELPSMQVAGLDPRYDGIIAKAMREDRDIRYQSATEMRYDLDHILTQPVIKVEPEATQAPAALPTEARPQRTAAQPYRPPQVYAPPPKPKSAMGGSLMWLSLIAVLGVGGYFMFFHQSKDPNGGTAEGGVAETASSTTTTPGAPPLLNLVPGKWTHAFEKLEDIHPRHRRADLGVIFQDGWFKSSKGKEFQIQRDNSDVAYMNFGVRASFTRKIRSDGNDDGNRIVLRRNVTGERCQIFLDEDQCSCQVSQKNSAGDVQNWGVIKKRVTPSIPVGKTYTLEFVAIGNLLVARCNGQLMFATRDDRNTKPGSAYILAYEDTRDVEFINLDSLSEAEALKIAGVDAQGHDVRTASSSTKVIANVPTPVPSTIPKPTTPPAPLTGLDLQLAQLEQSFQAAVERDAGSAFKAAVAKLNAGYNRALDAAIATATKSALLDDVVQLKEEQAAMTKLPSSAFPPPDEAKTPAALKPLRTTYRNAIAQYTSDYAKALVPLYEKYDQTLTALQAEQARISKIPEALRIKTQIEIMRQWRGSVLAKAAAQPGSISMAVISEGPSGSLQPGHPFTNSLGMKLVSIPGTNVPMCIHETRRKDYAAYVAANAGVDMSWQNPTAYGKSLGTGDEHPVCAVSWEDATAFCAWLSAKEGRTYRLPTGTEWNLAVVKNLAAPSNITSEAVYALMKNQYPWDGNDNDSQPPEGAGRYRDSGKQFDTTAPVMSFKPNGLRIYDLGGNVWEWCIDSKDGNSDQRIFRGAGYANYGGVLKSSGYGQTLRSDRSTTHTDGFPRPIGFRVVVEDEVATTTNTLAIISDSVSLFDGKTLKGWRVMGDPSVFSIDDGSIKTSASFGALLYTGTHGKPPEWTDFEFSATIKTGEGANSGVLFHMPTDGSYALGNGYKNIGFEVQVTHPNADGAMTGSLYWISQIKAVHHQDEWFKLRFTVKGKTFTCYINDEKVNEWTQPDDWQPPKNAPEARMGKGTIIIPSWKGEVWFKDIQVTNLAQSGKTSVNTPATNQTTAVSTAPASSILSDTKDKLFTNTLGMKFVPVPGTKVLFCMHETRRQDYAAYAAEVPGVDGSWKKTATQEGLPVGDQDDHPVVSVNWDDAQAFCAWLSKKEGRSYRLPTDEEWSFAVGIGQDEKRTKDTTPEMLVGKISNVFPWGTQLPPPQGAGNYADTTRNEKTGDKRFIQNYTDGFATTAPVMSFKSNKLGLYDLGGNVWEWCEDWYDNAQKERVLRGGSWFDHDHRFHLSAFRHHGTPGNRRNIGGFRVVVETGSSAP